MSIQNFSVPRKDIAQNICLGFVGSMLGGDSGGNLTMGHIIADKFNQAGYPIVLASSKNNKVIRLFDMLFTILSRHRDIDILIIQVYSGLSFIYVDICSWLGKFLGLPMIFHVHGGNIPNLVERKPCWARQVFNRADKFVAPSEYLAKSINKLGFSCITIPNIIELSKYPYRSIGFAKPKLIWLRSFHSIYNPTLAVKVVIELNKMGQKVLLTMVGPDKGDGSLDLTLETAQEYGVSQQISIIKGIPKSQVPYELSKSDIFINTTNIDNTPVSVIEAMACGLCIVSTNVGGIPYLLEDGVDALLVQPDDAVAMAKAVKKILNEPDLADKLSANARKKAEQFDWENILPRWEKILKVL
ncbi:MAG TPA: glycosyl transferase family 1 [Anaerolineaceae bacterium]|nr:glycosyl transferase family 1 [Anaerolineaceae bacterium]